MAKRTIEQRLRAAARLNPETDCWEWRAAIADPTGTSYGGITVDGKRYQAHRLAYETWVGPIPEGLEIDHLCRVRACINPDHLEVVTHAENMRRSRSSERRRLEDQARQQDHLDSVDRIEAARKRQMEETRRQIVAKNPRLAALADRYCQ